jgi:thiamine kinase-like enzyme
MVSDSKFLDTWRTWACGLKSQPVLVKALTGGQTNRSYLLDADGRKMVMRLNAPGQVPGIDRTREAQIWRAAYGAGLAPELLHFDPEAGFQITEYIEGAALDRSQMDGVWTDRVFDLLTATHGLEIDAPMLDYSLYIEEYWRLIESAPILHNLPLQRQRQPLQTLVAEFIASAPATGLCHHDPVMSNVIRDGDRLYLLDWEYATRGFIAMDYAVLSVDWDIADSVIIERTGIDPAVLDRAKPLYRYICDLWQEFH